MLGDVDLADFDSAAKIDFIFFEKIVVAQRHPFARRVAGQIVLTEVGPVVGQMLLAGEHDYAAGEAVFAEGLSGGIASGACADDDVGKLFVNTLGHFHIRHTEFLVVIRDDNIYIVILDFEIERGDRVDCRRLEMFAGAYVECRVVPGAGNLVVVERGVVEGRSVMIAMPGNCVVFVILACEQELVIAGFDDFFLTVSQIACPGNFIFLKDANINKK